MGPSRCPLCHNASVGRTSPESLLERVAGLLAVAPFRCRFCSGRFLAFRWGRYRTDHHGDRREFHRIPVRLALAFSGDQARGEGMIVDLSLGGCLIHTTMELHVDDLVYLRVPLSGQEPPLELAAVVRSAGSRGIGCKFLRAAREDARLASWLRQQEVGTAPAVRFSIT